MSAPTARTGWQKLSYTSNLYTSGCCLDTIQIQSTRSHTPTWIRIASTTTSRTERHSCKFAWLPPYNDMQNVPKRRQSSCSHYRSVCHQCKLTIQGCTSEPIHTRQANKEEQRKTPLKYLQSDSRKTLAVIYVCYLAILRAVCSQYCDVSQWCKLTLQCSTLIHYTHSR